VEDGRLAAVEDNLIISDIALTEFGREEDIERSRQSGFTTHQAD